MNKPTAEGQTFASGLSDEMRRELADFLRTRREKLKPEDVGIPSTTRRRTPGLRREEVAELAGVGTTWYTWLEQARDIQPSGEVLTRLAKALNLSTAETRHLFALTGKTSPSHVPSSEEPSAGLMRILNQAIGAPAIVLNARWDVIAANEPAKSALPNISALATTRGNYLRFLFSGQNPRVNMINWEASCRRLIAEFRASVTDLIDNPWVIELIESMKKDFPDFAKWWTEHDIFDNAPIMIEIRKPATGETYRRERTILTTLDDSRHKIVIFNPVQ